MAVSMKNVDAAFQGVGQKSYPSTQEIAVLTPFSLLRFSIWHDPAEVHLSLFVGAPVFLSNFQPALPSFLISSSVLAAFFNFICRGMDIWRIENFKPVLLSKTSIGKFYTGDSYIVLRVSDPISFHLWFATNHKKNPVLIIFSKMQGYVRS